MQLEYRSTGADNSDTSRQVRSLYQNLIAGWNNHDARQMADQFVQDGNMIGFDGSQVNGRAEIEAHLSQVFAHHVTAAYVFIVREVRSLSPEVAQLRAVVGMVPPGQSDINPTVNAIQSLVAVKQLGQWRVALFHNTPAAFHGRPEASEQLTAELRQVLRASSAN